MKKMNCIDIAEKHLEHGSILLKSLDKTLYKSSSAIKEIMTEGK